jgi:hypothetical protein
LILALTLPGFKPDGASFASGEQSKALPPIKWGAVSPFEILRSAPLRGLPQNDVVKPARGFETRPHSLLNRRKWLGEGVAEYYCYVAIIHGML